MEIDFDLWAHGRPLTCVAPGGSWSYPGSREVEFSWLGVYGLWDTEREHVLKEPVNTPIRCSLGTQAEPSSPEQGQSHRGESLSQGPQVEL